ncbi:hypothetical protein PHYBOEH_010098 [Phytophthora boehmeriae]|uniref:Uncharacterized protein n=1 Tax=Phytophthora boehmeriae TaxID=109152 RepID=A0A8T1VQ28_9STRA|nr:hypothetical protein PHYBOEH_010098 [Phytophthora boehmeriae]
MTDKAVGATSSPTSASSFSTPATRAIAPHPSSEPADISSVSVDASNQQQSPPNAAPSTSRKRVFTFQKRWLHTLPIVERSLPDTEVDGRIMKAIRSAGAASVSTTGAENHKDVIVCMLCDDPASKRELTKVWSRLNCRRGRIENHLMSKHPEFMRLLKHKREAEGDTAVQLFLENMRSGRCNVRNEINLGLYNQLQSAGNGDGDNAAVRSALAVATGAGVEHTELQKRAFGDYAMRDQLMELENMRKRTKLAASEKDEASVYSAGSMMMLRSHGGVNEQLADAVVEASALSALQQDTATITQWQSVFFNKLVVITGGDNIAMTTIATQLWLFGASVVLNFSNLTALDDFNTKHIGRFPDPSSDSEGMARGVMMPTTSSFQTHDEIEAWGRTIAEKFQRVDYLINFVDSNTEKAVSSSDQQSDDCKEEVSSGDGKKRGSIVSVPMLLEALCKSIHVACFQHGVDDGSALPSNGSIVNIAPARDDSAIASLTKSLAAELQPRNLQVNSILLPPRQSVDDTDDMPFDLAALSHLLLFLLSPSSRLLSGSVLRLQQDRLLSVDAAASRRSAVSPSATSLTAVDATSGEIETSHSI